jgi:hypothetical protein
MIDIFQIIHKQQKKKMLKIYIKNTKHYTFFFLHERYVITIYLIYICGGVET